MEKAENLTSFSDLFGDFDNDSDGEYEDGSQSTLGSIYELVEHGGGQGSYGVVRCAQNKKTGAIVAIKTYLPRSEDGVPVSTMREIALLKELSHPNIMSVIGVNMEDVSIDVILEYYNADLSKYMHDTGREGMTMNHIKSFLHQLISGIEYCHSRRIIHRDIKPRNLLINHHGKLCITDFGLSKVLTSPKQIASPKVATLNYRAPELLLSYQDYTVAIDIWGVGCVFAEMMLLTPIFPCQENIGQILSIFRIMGTPNESCWPGIVNLVYYSKEYPDWKKKDLKEYICQNSSGLEMSELGIDLLESLLIYCPSQRITAKKALEHPYFYDNYDMLLL